MAPKTKELNERDTKLVQWLNEAHAKESELEADLTAHIGMTQKPAYKKRLQQHLKETREHKRSVARRIKQLGGQASAGPDVPGAALACQRGDRPGDHRGEPGEHVHGEERQEHRCGRPDVAAEDARGRHHVNAPLFPRRPYK